MAYRKPADNELADYISQDEHDAVSLRLRRSPERVLTRELNQRARRNAWMQHRHTGPVGRIRALCESQPGAFTVLREYCRTTDVSQMVAAASRHERARFASRVERHDLSDEVIGVRVTFLGFDNE